MEREATDNNLYRINLLMPYTIGLGLPAPSHVRIVEHLDKISVMLYAHIMSKHYIYGYTCIQKNDVYNVGVLIRETATKMMTLNVTKPA